MADTAFAQSARDAGLTLPGTPDFDSYPVGQTIMKAEIDAEGVTVIWNDGRRDHFNRFWLRENDTQHGAIHPLTRERDICILDIPEDVGASAATVDEAGALTLTWAPDGVTTRHHPGWLRAMADGAWHPDTDLPEQVTWDAEGMPEPVSFDGPTVLGNEAVFADWLRALRVHGLARLRGLPDEHALVQRVAERIGTVRPSNFGFLFTVESKPDPDSNAYTSSALEPHTDLGSRELQPGLQLLHCRENTCPDGLSVMVDGFAVAKAMQAEEPEHFAALCELDWLFSNRHRETDYRWAGPMLERDASGNITEVRFTGLLRANPAMPPADISRAYAAVRALTAHVMSKRFRCTYPFRSGDLVIFDNRRILHGRDAFNPNGGTRRLEGCYVDRDELHSRLRIIARKARAASS